MIDDVEESTSDSSAKRTTVVRRIVAIVVTVVMVASIVWMVVVLARIGVIPTGYMVIAIIADVVVGVGLSIWLLTTKSPGHNARFVVSLVLSLLLIIMNFVAIGVGNSYNAFTGELQPGDEQVLYDVIGLDSGSHSLSPLIGTDIPLDSTDPLYDAAVEAMSDLIDVNVVQAPSQDGVLDAVLSGQSKAGIVQDAYLQIFSEADEDSFDKLVVLATFLVDANAAPIQFNTPTPSVTPPPPVNSEASFVVYISGIDVAGPVSTRSRSDVNILMVVDPKDGKILLVNTPRDFYVQLAGKDGLKDKLTHAGVYGIDTSVQTLENLYSISIDYYLRMNFTSFVQIVDVIGGVDVQSDYAFSHRGYDFVQGVNHMDGAKALVFARERYAFSAGDRTRGQNQEAVIKAIVDKMTDPSVLTKYPQILPVIANAVQTSMPADRIDKEIQTQLTDSTKWAITSISVDGTGAYDYTFSYPREKLYVMVPDQATIDAAKVQINAYLQQS